MSAITFARLLRGTDLLGRMALERMIAGLSTRNDRSGLEPVGVEVEERAVGTGKSSVCRRFIAQTATALAELLARPLNEVDLVALMVDGVHCGEQTCLVALGIDITGVKHRLAIVEGATENATVVRELLAGLGERGLDVTGPILVVIDGAKELRSAVDDVFDQPIIQRCQEHKDPERAGQAASAAAERQRAADACGLPRREHDCGWLLGDEDAPEPLDVRAADPAGHERANGESVIFGQCFTVERIGQGACPVASPFLLAGRSQSLPPAIRSPDQPAAR